MVILLQDLYRFVFAQGIAPPFSISTSIPRVHLSLCNAGDETIGSHHLDNCLLMIESRAEDELDEFLSLLELHQEVCLCSHHF